MIPLHYSMSFLFGLHFPPHFAGRQFSPSLSLMAFLHFFLSPSPPSAWTQTSPTMPSDLVRCAIVGDRLCRVPVTLSGTKRSSRICVRSSLDAAGSVVVVGKVTEVTKNTFWPIVEAAGDKAVVLDMYTQWFCGQCFLAACAGHVSLSPDRCGPCKVIAPKFQELSEKYLDVIFLKLDCNQENKPLAKELGIRVVPTFKILKNSKIVKEVKGAKYDDLVVAIEGVRSG
ncbi:Thioredoxin domain [Dillenia turbinata]|uniref:Thioredoxin domain n=1 Tax=Dillenia turbinata TaxID=194707 RepID=A0AAN8YTZ3_9MAGN